MKKLLIALLVIALLSVSAPAFAKHHTEPYAKVFRGALKVSKTLVAPGQTITASGKGFVPNSNVSVLWDGKYSATVSASPDGSISFSFTVPSGAKLGLHTLSAQGPRAKGGTLILSHMIIVKKTKGKYGSHVYSVEGGSPGGKTSAGGKALWPILLAGLALIASGFGIKALKRE